jgi:hypothetical protein
MEKKCFLEKVDFFIFLVGYTNCISNYRELKGENNGENPAEF